MNAASTVREVVTDTLSSNYYTKTETDTRIEDRITSRLQSLGTFDATSYYNKNEINTMFILKLGDFVPYADLNAQVTNNGFIKMPAVDAKLASYLQISAADTKVAELGYVKGPAVDTAIATAVAPLVVLNQLDGRLQTTGYRTEQ